MRARSRDVGTACLGAGTAFGTAGLRKRSVSFRELGLKQGWGRGWLTSEGGGEAWPKPLAKNGRGQSGGPRDWMGAGRGGAGPGRGRGPKERRPRGPQSGRWVGVEPRWAVKRPGPTEEAG